jgi:glycosyltransferase involved in cell wall biosynthesis
LIHVRAEADGADMPGSPFRLPRSDEFDQAARAAFSAALGAFSSDADLDDRIAFLAAERDKLLQLRADRQSMQPAQSIAPPRRALVIDHHVPRPSHDGGSSAIVSHVQSLQRLGYSVMLAPQTMVGGADAADLERQGIICCCTPWYGSVEDVLRRHADRFDLVYLHRVSIATAYAALVRQTQRRATLLYGVADLHHLRLARQAAFEDRTELLREAERLQAVEQWSAQVADTVVTHSATEAEWLRRSLPAEKVHVVPWAMPIRRQRPPFAARLGLALLGNFTHSPNLAAAHILRDEILPLLQREDPSIPVELVGEGLPPAFQRPCAGLSYTGHVDDLDELFDRVRLTIAPLPYGAGLKGKVLASLSAGIPCICSPAAAEGMGLPPRLQDLIVPDAPSAVRLILRLHNDEHYHARLSKRCLDFATRAFSTLATDTALRRAIDVETRPEWAKGEVRLPAGTEPVAW